MALTDTAESYGEGRSEELISHVIAGQRERVFLVSKVETHHVTGDGIARACEASLAPYLDLYLLHWPVPSAEFSRVVAEFESLRVAGKVRAWGVSNFTVRQMEDLFQIPQGDLHDQSGFTTSTTVALNMNCCHGASSTACQ
jgi:diketogulonate reductase-like aldo/keto reductase